MSRAPWLDGELEYRSFGTPGAPRAVFVLRTGAVATTDPDPRITSGHDVRIVAIGLDAPELEDPPAFGGQTPAGLTVDALKDLLEREAPETTVGLVGERSAGPIAIHLAAAMGERVDRLALVGVRSPSDALSRDMQTPMLDGLAAETLVLIGEDATPDASDARWYEDRIPTARIEILDAARFDNAQGELTLGAAWAMVLEHVAPGAGRR